MSNGCSSPRRAASRELLPDPTCHDTKKLYSCLELLQSAATVLVTATNQKKAQTAFCYIKLLPRSRNVL